MAEQLDSLHSYTRKLQRLLRQVTNVKLLELKEMNLKPNLNAHGQQNPKINAGWTSFSCYIHCLHIPRPKALLHFNCYDLKTNKTFLDYSPPLKGSQGRNVKQLVKSYLQEQRKCIHTLTCLLTNFLHSHTTQDLFPTTQ